MTRLPSLSAKKVIRALNKAGYEIDHQKGRHIDSPNRRLTIPKHPEIAKGTLRTILRQSGFTAEEFLKLLKRLDWYIQTEIS